MSTHRVRGGTRLDHGERTVVGLLAQLRGSERQHSADEQLPELVLQGHHVRNLDDLSRVFHSISFRLGVSLKRM